MYDPVNTHSTLLDDKRPWIIKITCTQCDWLMDVNNKHDTCAKHSNDRDDTCTTILTTSCVSVIDVYIVNTTQTKPSTSLEWGRKHDITIKIPKKIVGRTNENEERHVEETHKMTFYVCAHACYWGQDDMTMTKNPPNSTKRCALRGVLIYNSYPQCDHASNGVFMWSWPFPLLGSLFLLLNSLGVISTCHLFL